MPSDQELRPEQLIAAIRTALARYGGEVTLDQALAAALAEPVELRLTLFVDVPTFGAPRIVRARGRPRDQVDDLVAATSQIIALEGVPFSAAARRVLREAGVPDHQIAARTETLRRRHKRFRQK